MELEILCHDQMERRDIASKAYVLHNSTEQDYVVRVLRTWFNDQLKQAKMCLGGKYAQFKSLGNIELGNFRK